jgi:hypothetical protein
MVLFLSSQDREERPEVILHMEGTRRGYQTLIPDYRARGSDSPPGFLIPHPAREELESSSF